MDKEFKKLRSLFLSRTSIDKLFCHLNNTIGNNYNETNQLLIHSHTSDSETAKQYPLAKSYTLKFLKELIKQIEESRNIVNELIYNNYVDLLNQKDDDQFYYVTYSVCDEEFTFKQSDKLVTDGTTGLRWWEAGIQLFEQVYANKDQIFKNKRILELGSGIGLSGILIAALTDIESYTFSDHHEKVLDLINENLEINGFNLNKNLDKKLNKFYEFEDEEGNKSAKYYETDDNDDSSEPFGNSFKIGSFNGFGSFVRQGPMDLALNKKTSNEFDFDDKFTKFSLNDDKNYENTDIFSLSDNGFKDDEEQDKELKEKIKKLDKHMVNFEQLLKDFEQKLCVVEDKNSLKTKSTIKKSSKCRNKTVNVTDLDWFSSNDLIVEKLNKIKPDYLIGADIVYDPKIIPDLIRVFKLCLSTLDSIGIIIVCSIRNEETIKEFEQKLRQFQKTELNIKIQRNKLASKLTYFKNLELNTTKFVLYNIRNEEEDD